MSTYEDDHNLRAAPPEHRNPDGNERSRPTLSTIMSEFLENSHSTESVPNVEDGARFGSLMNGLRSLESELASTLIEQLESNPQEKKGVPPEYLDKLDRVKAASLDDDAVCSICTNEFKTDKYPLIVKLPCKFGHIFDLECIGPWLEVNPTCPLCRQNINDKKEIILPVDSEEEEEDWEIYG